MKPRDPAIMFVSVTVLALILRVIQVLLMSDAAVNPHWLRPVQDAAVLDAMARGLATGAWPTDAPFFTAPLYPLVLGALYAVLGTAPLPVLLVQALISALGAGLAALAARRLWGARAGWLAGILYAMLWTSIFFAAELLAVSLTVILLLLLLWLLLRLDHAPEAPPAGRSLVICGLVWGLAVVARPTLLVLAPAFIWYLWRYRGLGRRPLPWLLFAVGFVLPILPVTLHNVVRGGDTVLIATSGGPNFYAGNNAEADGATVMIPGIPPTRQGMAENLQRLAERETGRSLRPSQVDRWFLGQGLGFWVHHPGQALRLQLTKLRLLVAMHERSNNKNLYFWRDRSLLLKWPVWPGMMVLLPLAVLGFWRRDLDPGARVLLLGSVALFAAALLLFFVNGRFRLPLLAMLTIPAAGGLEQAWLAWRARSREMSGNALLVASGLLVASVLPDLATFKPGDTYADPNIWYALGNSYLAAGDDSNARHAFNRAVARYRANPQAAQPGLEESLFVTFGDLLSRRHLTHEALQLYAGWVQANPRTVEGRVRLGDALLEAGRRDEAARQFAQVQRLDPENVGARIGLAWIAYYRGDWTAAHAAFEEAHRHEPNAHALFGAGLSLIQMGRLDEAERAFREVLVLDPGYWQAWGNLAGIYEQQGEIAKATEAYRHVLEKNPRDERAQAWVRKYGSP